MLRAQASTCSEIDFTLLKWPATGPLLQACGIPMSAVVQPAGASSSPRTPTAAAGLSLLSALARCKHCYAYINYLCELGESSFTCSVCGRSTELKSLTVWHNQYCRYPAARQHLPELQQQVYEVLVDPSLQEGGTGGYQQQQFYQADSAPGSNSRQQPAVQPVTIALVDAAGPDDFLDLVRGGLTVAMEALPPGSLFGIIGISDCITLVDMSGPSGPALHHLPVLESVPALVALEEVVPLTSLLVTVETAKTKLAKAMELLIPDSMRVARAASSSSSSHHLQQATMDRRPGLAAAGPPSSNPQAHAGPVAAAAAQAPGAQQQQQQHGSGSYGLNPPCRAVGPAIQAVVEYLRNLHSPHLARPVNGPADAVNTPGSFSGVAQLLLFLSGPPDIGIGKTVAATAASSSSSGAGGVRSGGTGPAAAGGGGSGGRTVGPASGDLNRQLSDLQLHFPVQDPKSKAFYEQAAVAAASMGIVVDVYAAARGYVGLQTLEPLVNSTGGALFLYPSAEEATLPQDLYRRLSTPKALCGMLRVRCCPQVRVSRSYGRLYPDPEYKDLFHIPCCDPGQAFAFDFEHLGSGVYDERFQHVTVQMAFQYSQVVAASRQGGAGISSAGSGGSSSSSSNLLQGGQQQQQLVSGSMPGAEGGSSSSRTYIVQRRLRVCTVRLPVAVSPLDVYSSVDADTVLTVLTHKITKAVRAQSVSEARLLLRDWLVIFTANYHRNSYMRASTAQLVKLPVDLTFGSCPALQPLPRFVYALLRSPLLSSAAQYHSDLTSYLHHLWCALPPSELSKAVYPRLTAFADPDTLIASGLPLSRHSLQGPVLAEAAAAAAKQAVEAAKGAAAAGPKAAAAAAATTTSEAGDTAAAAVSDVAGAAGATSLSAEAQAALSLSTAVTEGKQAANIMLLDAFILVLVLYRAGASAEVPYPPPQNSRLWRLITDIKREHRVTTHVEVVRDGNEGADLFYSLLIDDPDDMDSPSGGQQIAAAAGGAGGATAGGPSGPAPTGVEQFVQHIKAEVFMQLQPSQ